MFTIQYSMWEGQDSCRAACLKKREERCVVPDMAWGSDTASGAVGGVIGLGMAIAGGSE